MAKLHIKNTDGTFTPYSTIAVTNLDIVQGKGNSLTSAMSQKAVTDEFGTIQDAIASIVNAGYVFAGVATPSTNPGTPEAKVFYIAKGKGTYANFGGLEVTEDEVVILYYDSSWHKLLTGIASNQKLSELETDTNRLKPLSVFVQPTHNFGIFNEQSINTSSRLNYNGAVATVVFDNNNINITKEGARFNLYLWLNIEGLEVGKQYDVSFDILGGDGGVMLIDNADKSTIQSFNIENGKGTGTFVAEEGVSYIFGIWILYSIYEVKVSNLYITEHGAKEKIIIESEFVPAIGDVDELHTYSKQIVGAINEIKESSLQDDDTLVTIQPKDYADLEGAELYNKSGTLGEWSTTKDSITLNNAGYSNAGVFFEIKGLEKGVTYTFSGETSNVKELRLYSFQYSQYDGTSLDIATGTQSFNIDFENTYGRVLIFMSILYNVQVAKLVNLRINKKGDKPYKALRSELIRPIGFDNLDDYLKSTLPFNGKELFTIGDSECAGGIWQKRVSEITGCIFDQEKNSKPGSTLSLGGTSMYGSSLEMGLIRVTNLVKEKYHPDYIILENVNDQSAWSYPDGRLGAITDNAHFITNLLDGGLKSDWDSDAVTLLASIPSENRQFGTSIQLTANVAGKNVKITSMPTKNGNVKLRLHEDAYNHKDYVISVSSTDTLMQILDKILEYDYEWFVDTLDSEGTGVDFSYHGSKGQSNVNVTLIDVDNTGMQISVSDTDQAKSVTLKHYYGKTLNDNDWTNINNWRDTVKFYEAWKGVIEYCLKNFPTAQLYILVFPHLGNVYPADYLNADSSYNMEAYRSAFSNVKSLYSAQRALAEYYNLPCIDLVANMGISPANMAAWFPDGNVHPTNEGFRYLGEKIAKIMMSK